jgi:hypothetical protein
VGVIIDFRPDGIRFERLELSELEPFKFGVYRSSARKSICVKCEGCKVPFKIKWLTPRYGCLSFYQNEESGEHAE